MNDRQNQRLTRIAEALRQTGALRIREASDLLGVSEMTVRRDIAACDGLFRYLGGYIVKGREAPDSAFYVFDREKETHLDGKRAACALAAGFIEPRDTIFIDCGTTLPHLARLIPGDWRITLVCYALNVSTIVCDNPNITLILLGGVYQPSSASFAGAESLEMLKRIGINKAFLSAGGIDADHGASCSNFHEVPIKREAMHRAVRKYLVADASKFGKVRPAFFAALDEFDGIITDAAVDADTRARFAAGAPPLLIGGPGV
ncbi:MAG: DeoR/GlpR transcriptional regulator [Telmatospirillum sp.]|nr:DeoR/GlpR transcriptional regulator [Telmatospirillum sp.]